MYDKDPLSALEALEAAQRLAFAPLAFQASVILRDKGVLAAMAAADPGVGLSIDELSGTGGLPEYAVRVLLEAGLGMHIVYRRGDRYHLGRVGLLLLNDEMTRVNFDFTRDICYQAAAHLDQSLCEQRPAGLATLGPWQTLYEGLSSLPEPKRNSWYAFDHYYSDLAFPVIVERLAQVPPVRLLDVGCNTGRFAQACLGRIPTIEIALADLPQQLVSARQRLESSGHLERVSFHPVDLLDSASELPDAYPVIWMSQFLDCFSEEQIVDILGKVKRALSDDGRLWILEPFWDRQRFEAAAFSLQQTSLYFSCVANGNSQMYESTVFICLLERSGFIVEKSTDGVGGFHTLLECRRGSEA
ncbi:MAG: class I SAM-dependent methyltransferase [Parahaliea sp.]